MVQVVYVSPLKALSNDIQRNLEAPLRGIAANCEAAGHAGCRDPRAGAHRRYAAGRARRDAQAPPHILVTTPESLYLLLTSESGRAMLASTRTVIVDEIHAVAGNKRGSHLALSLERLAALAGRRCSASACRPRRSPSRKSRISCGRHGCADACVIVDSGHRRVRDLALVLPDAPLEAVMSQ